MSLREVALKAPQRGNLMVRCYLRLLRANALATTSLFPYLSHKLNLLNRLITPAAFVTIVGIHLDILFACPMIVRSINCRRWADFIHQAYGEKCFCLGPPGEINTIEIRKSFK